jgi:hypothetical protein
MRFRGRGPYRGGFTVPTEDVATPWDERAGLVAEAKVVFCRRRGAAIDLVLARPQLARSQFVFT